MDFIANPKAIAAQTFISRSLQEAYYESRCWELLGPFFSLQFSLEAPPQMEIPPDDTGQWIGFPWALGHGSEERATCVWFERRNGRRYVRHLRLYTDLDLAAADNREIERLIVL